jgi:hypothetical protein
MSMEMAKESPSWRMEPLIFSPFRLSDLKLCRKIDRFEAKPGTIQSQCLTSACDRRQTRRLSLLSRITVEILYYTGTPFVREFLSLSTFLKTSTAQKINEWGLTHHWGASQKGIILFSPGTCESNAKHHHSGHPEEENVVARLHQVQGEKSTADKKDR